jgi:uncharacterized DUF497 family protein
MSIRFQWDPQKAARNATKHGVTDVIRIISARKADREEREGYENTKR